TSRSSGSASTPGLSSKKCFGASTCVPVCVPITRRELLDESPAAIRSTGVISYSGLPGYVARPGASTTLTSTRRGARGIDGASYQGPLPVARCPLPVTRYRLPVTRCPCPIPMPYPYALSLCPIPMPIPMPYPYALLTRPSFDSLRRRAYHRWVEESVDDVVASRGLVRPRADRRAGGSVWNGPGRAEIFEGPEARRGGSGSGAGPAEGTPEPRARGGRGDGRAGVGPRRFSDP